MITKTLRVAVCMVASLLIAVGASAQADSAAGKRIYSEEQPLIFEGEWDLWPYSFLNDKGDPEGYNVDLIRIVMKRLGIPYIIKLRPAAEVFTDLKNGKSDLTLALAVGYHDQYGIYGKNAVTLFTQSVVTPKDKPVQIKNFRDLGKPGLKVIVNENSMCYHLMQDYGWEENAIPEKDISEVMQRVSATDEGQIVWNTLTLKWLMHRYLIDNLQLTPVNMPHGEYKFMSNDQQLLDRLDAELTDLNASESLKPLQDKWFYPERLKPGIPRWVWYAAAAVLTLLLIFSVYTISYRMQNRRLTRDNNKRNRRLSLILQTSHVRLWTYDIKASQFSWRNDNGQVAYTYTMDEFAQRYSPEDFVRLKETLDKLAANKKKTGEEEEEITLNLKAKDTEGGDNELRDFVIVLSVLTRDKEGMPTIIIGTKKDVTEELEQKRLDGERALRYWSIFYTPIVGIILFDKNGILVNINPKACEMFQCDPEAIIDEKVSINSLLDLGELRLQDCDGYYATQYVDLDKIPAEKRMVKSIKCQGKLCNEFRLMTVNGDNGEQLGVFAICRDISTSVHGIDLELEGQKRVSAVKAVLNDYTRHINQTLDGSDIRMADYSPDSHTLTIYSSTSTVQHALTQTRCMTLVDDRSKSTAMRLLNSMDDRTDKTVEAGIRTTLRTKDGLRLEVWFKLVPLRDKAGNVTRYAGILRDESRLREVEHLMAVQTAKVQEVESTKNSFVKNMVQEIRTPMGTVLDYVARLDETAPTADEDELHKGILNNADYLLHLIDNILYLSRLQANMVEIIKQPRDFAEVFEAQCTAGWEKFRNENTRYLVENPYDQLVVDIDAENLAHAIAQLTANAAQHTANGFIRARYDYIGRRLMIFIEDTGEGIPKKELARINKHDAAAAHTTKGLGLAITKELISQMGGTVEISSEEGIGTTAYLAIPCHASAIKRKKLV